MVSVKRIVLVLWIIFLGMNGASADRAESDWVPNWRLSLFTGQWWETNLLEVPENIVKCNYDLRKAYYLSDNVNRTLIGNFYVPVWGMEEGIPFGAVEVDTQVINHFGADDSLWEFSGVFTLRSIDFPVWFLRANLMVGEGLSYTFGELVYEKGEDGVRGEGQQRLQNHLVFETELFMPAHSRMELVLRLHHRSGIYGLISSSQTGSNCGYKDCRKQTRRTFLSRFIRNEFDLYSLF